MMSDRRAWRGHSGRVTRLFSATMTTVPTGFWVLLLANMLTGPAVGGELTCSGTITATSLNPTKPGSAMDFRVMNKSADNLALAEDFSNGLREMGATISSGGPLILAVTFLVTEPAETSAVPKLHSDFAWMSKLDLNAGAGSANPAKAHLPTLKMTASVSNKQNADLMWVATVECAVATTDGHRLAHDLGVMISRHYGKSVIGEKLQ